MANLLVVLTQPDTQAIRQAEANLKPLLKDPRCVPALVEILKARDTQVSYLMIGVGVTRDSGVTAQRFETRNGGNAMSLAS